VAKKSALEMIADLENQKAKLAAEAIKELTGEFEDFATKIGAIQVQQREVNQQIVELGGKSLISTGKAASKGSGKPTAFSGSLSEVVAFIKEAQGSEGVASRAITGRYGKGWEKVIGDKATKKGEGPSGRWFVK
jgi:hypothetical protein